MSTVESKYSKLNANISDKAEQLIYPIDLVGDKSYSPYVVIFEPNIIKGHTTPYTHSTVKSANKIPGAYGDEVSMQTSDGDGNYRRDHMDPIYKKSGESIVLPMHNQINTTYIANWQNTELGGIGRISDFFSSVGNMNGGEVAANTGQAVMQGMVNAIQKTGISNTKDALQLETGISPNTYSEVLFKGVNNRAHAFSWNIVPRNLKEAEVVRAIIHRFKYHMLPEIKEETAGSSYMLHPSTFDISFIDLTSGKSNGWVHRISTCALTQFTVNGTPNGEYSITKDGAFTAVTIDLMMTELIALGKNNMQDVYNQF